MAYYLKKMGKELSASGINVHDDVVGPPFDGRSSPSNGTPKEQEKRIRREIANSNERRRMQSINSGFQSLRTLLPNHDGEKLSKAAILQQTSDYIYRLEQEKTTLLNQVVQLKRLLKKYEKMEDGDSPSPKRRKRNDSMMDEGIGSPESMEDTIPSNRPHEDIRRDIVELRCQLDRERRYRMVLEEQNRTLEAQLYPEKLKELAKQIQIQEQQQVFHDRKIELEVAAAQQRTMLIQYQVPQQAPPAVAPTTSTTSRQNLETIVQAIRHLEGDKPTPGNTPVQTPSHTPTPEDEARKQRDDAPPQHFVEPPQVERIELCRKTMDNYTTEADREVDQYTSQQRLHVELVHPVDRLTTRPMTSPMASRPTPPPPRPSIIVS
ncbi:transcription factor AP-4-like [Amphiura filiformis]|uniref:transcription factor AP-4-like n=1 Tax=Amphiura filiformis TaxID=82378 RepID=UPI003B224B43